MGEAEREFLERFDNFANLRNGLGRIATGLAEYAGLPMPLDDDELVVEPAYKFIVDNMSASKPPDKEEADGLVVRNMFWSTSKRCWICVWEEDGKVGWMPVFERTGFYRDIHTIGCSVAWGIEQESNAVQVLAGLLRHYQLKCYLLTGSFLERSRRSNLIYMFRKLRPTIVLAGHEGDDSTRILCTLCLHPIAYYKEAAAGAMAPTDDVVAHLMLMRGDERMFWRRANQHPPWHPSSRLL